MAASKFSQGYKCEFVVDCVSDYLYCKKCTLVARKLNITTCCGESYCNACITVTQEEGKPCPACGEKDFDIVGHIKNQKQINCLQVYCSMKENGCNWSGTLEQLDTTHLDPDQDNCQYVDTKCPLNCHVTIPKNKVEQHVAQHCARRPYVCQHCNFKATYEEVVDTHLPECKYVPLQCPNLCGVNFERDFMEDHMKMCRLQEVGCEFSGVGCDGQFIREDQEEHTRQNSQKHLTLTASLAVETKEQLQQKLLEQDKKHKEEEEKLRQKIEEQEKKLLNQDNEHNKEKQKLMQKMEELEGKLDEQEKKLEKKFEEQEEKIEKQKKELDEQKRKFLDQTRYIEEIERLKDQQRSMKAQLSELSNLQISMNRTFTMIGFDKAKATSSIWRSPVMYTHLHGYKFNVEVRANGLGTERGKGVRVDVCSMPGDFDSQLKWPAKARFKLELINQHGGNNLVSCKDGITWCKSANAEFITLFGSKYHSGYFHLIDQSEVGDYLKNDSLYFLISTIVLES